MKLHIYRHCKHDFSQRSPNRSKPSNWLNISFYCKPALKRALCVSLFHLKCLFHSLTLLTSGAKTTERAGLASLSSLQGVVSERCRFLHTAWFGPHSLTWLIYNLLQIKQDVIKWIQFLTFHSCNCDSFKSSEQKQCCDASLPFLWQWSVPQLSSSEFLLTKISSIYEDKLL